MNAMVFVHHHPNTHRERERERDTHTPDKKDGRVTANASVFLCFFQDQHLEESPPTRFMFTLFIGFLWFANCEINDTQRTVPLDLHAKRL